MTRQQLPEQRVVYSSVPPRRSAARQTITQAQPRTAHSMGHEVGIQPEDAPYITAEQPPRANRLSQHPVRTEDDIYRERRPSSVRRYRQPAVRVEEEPRAWPVNWRSFLLACAVVAIAAIFAAMLLTSVLVPAWTRWQDGLHYSYPRIYQADHNGSHYIAVNNAGVVELVIIPAVSELGKQKSQLYVVTRLSGANADLVPVTNIAFADVLGNGRQDIEVTTGDTITVLFDTGQGGYSPNMPAQ